MARRRNRLRDQGYRRRHTLGPDLCLVGWLAAVQICTCDMLQNFKFSGYMTVSGLCMHDFCARASAPWKSFCCLLKFLLKKCYKCRVGSKKSESRGVGWLVGAKSESEGPVQTYDVCGTPDGIPTVLYIRYIRIRDPILYIVSPDHPVLRGRGVCIQVGNTARCV